MAAARPFASAEAMAASADAIWWALDRPDWLEAFAAHPEIGPAALTGERPVASAATPPGRTRNRPASPAAAEQTRRRLAEANRDYQARFGYIFIVCATGKTADEMLALLERRLRHDPDDELRVAAEEQRKITRLRLAKLLEQEPDTP